MEVLWIAIETSSFPFLICLILLDIHDLFEFPFDLLHSLFLGIYDLLINCHNYLNLISRDLL